METPISVLTDARKYITVYFAKKGISVEPRGTLVQAGATHKLHTEIMRSLLLDYTEQLNQYNMISEKKFKSLTDDRLRQAVDEFISDELLHRRSEVCRQLQHQPKPCEVKTFVRALTGQEDVATIAVMCHWIWQVKRKLNCLPVKYHLMPILYGRKHGAGKSYAVKSLCGPLSFLMLDTTLREVLNAEKFGVALSRNFIAFFDEMAGAKKADVEEFKRLITADYNSVRQFYSQDVIRLPQNATFIGTSNKPVGEILYDPTGMRRFFEISTAPVIDWSAINSLDYLQLWQSIDENKEEGYFTEHKAAVEKAQESLVGQDEVMAFMEYFGITPEAAVYKEILVSDLFDKFKLYCEENGMRLINSVWFGRRMSSSGIQQKFKKIGGKTYRVYLIDEESAIHAKLYDAIDLKPKKGEMDQ